MKSKKFAKRAAALAVFLVVMLVTLFLLQRLLMPKYMSDIPEGAMVEEYYQETTDHEVIFVGDCEVYENFSPITLYEDYGITSYIRGSAQQLTWQSYYLLEDTLRYETPKVVVFNVLAMKYNEPQSEAYNRMSIDGMKMSSSKIGAIQASMTEEENMLDYIFPILRYHSRWSDMFHKDKVSHNGYYMRVDVRPADGFPEPEKLSDYTLGDKAMEYLDKMRELCEENGIELVLVKSPSLYPHWYDEWDEQIVEYADKYGLDYFNYEKMADDDCIHRIRISTIRGRPSWSGVVCRLWTKPAHPQIPFCKYGASCRRCRLPLSLLPGTALPLCHIHRQRPRCHGRCRGSLPRRAQSRGYRMPYVLHRQIAACGRPLQISHCPDR